MNLAEWIRENFDAFKRENEKLDNEYEQHRNELESSEKGLPSGHGGTGDSPPGPSDG